MIEQDPLASKRALLARIQTEGAEAAYQALLGVCRDPKAPAPAKATSGTTLFRVGGFMDIKQGGADKSPEDMTPDEIASRISDLRAKREQLEAGLSVDDDQDEDGSSVGRPDLFG